MGNGKFSNYPGGFANGVTIQGVPVLNTQSGNAWWVSSTAGADGNPGTFMAPFATLGRAFSFAKAGDIVFLKSGHAETVSSAAGIDLNVAGVQVVGLGLGSSMPTFTFSTSTAATMRMSAASISISGCRFICGIDSLVTMWTFTAVKCAVMNCRFADDGTHTGLSYIDLVNITANVANQLTIINNEFYNKVAGNYNHAIGLNTVQDAVEVGANYIYGTFALSGIHNVTGKVLTNVNVHDNYVKNLTAAVPALNFISACTGVAYNNILEPGDSTVASAKFNTAIDASGNNVGAFGRMDAGSEFWFVKKGVVSSTILQTGVDLSVASIGGELAIEDFILKTNGTGLAAATNLNLLTNNANGVLIFGVTAVSGLGANKTINMANASVTANGRTVLELGKKLQLSCTAADCTGAGTVDVYIKLRRITAGATVTVA